MRERNPRRGPVALALAAVPKCNGLDVTVGGATQGPDTLVGTAGDDVIAGLGGDDTLVGGAVRDALYGRSGNDQLDAKDGRADLKINCGPGIDGARTDDRIDPPAIACETVSH